VDSVPAFWVKHGANDLNCVDVPLNPAHSLGSEYQNETSIKHLTVSQAARRAYVEKSILSMSRDSKK